MPRAFFSLVLLAGAFFFCGMELLQYREEIGTLKDQAAAQGDIGNAQKENEAAFQKAQSELAAGRIKAGDSSKQLRGRLGAPSSASPEGKGERWLYRSSKGKMLERPWIFFYFDAAGSLLRWECGHTPACPDNPS